GAGHDGYVKAVVWTDFDNDGLPDIYLSQATSKNILFHNDGPKKGPDGEWGWSFTDVTERAGVGDPVYSFPALVFDYDNDGWQDIFVVSRLNQDLPTDASSAVPGGGRAKGQDKID